MPFRPALSSFGSSRLRRLAATRVDRYRVTARAAFKQDDVTRAIKGVRAAGLDVARVEIQEGRIVVLIGEQANANEPNPLDRLHAA